MNFFCLVNEARRERCISRRADGCENDRLQHDYDLPNRQLGNFKRFREEVELLAESGKGATLFGKNLRVKKLRAGITLEELGKRLGLSKSSCANYETRGQEPSYDILISLAKILNTSVDDLLGSGVTKKAQGMINKAFGQKLRRVRMAAGYETAKDFSSAVGIGYDTYRTFEQGREPKYKSLCKICAALHTTPNEILGFSEESITQEIPNVRVVVNEDRAINVRVPIRQEIKPDEYINIEMNISRVRAIRGAEDAPLTSEK